MLTVAVVGSGGAGPGAWDVGPRIVARLTGDRLTGGQPVPGQRASGEQTHVEGVQVLASTDLPVRLLSADSGLDELIMVESTRAGGTPGSIRQSVMETHGPGRPEPGTTAPGGVMGALTSLHLPPRVVVFSVEAGLEDGSGDGEATSVLADRAVDEVFDLVIAELRRLDASQRLA
ncbi:hypothetical protein SAMN05421678_102354 [Actinopolymorpha cephalotaxi]|uniref:Hydrogenase maturation protease n=1 Tax=Actinopolymorpha cephalotaxi TaxID=504797 RepID=A0A1I2LX93_9ACTN|nr:hypothetical protein [Actinopolymorpha cephalotaxi]NYH81491.1 hypothetical protein [Actinopolymorpha cephalotaxi]SFF83942.1 hypothetical protein SAMN05421678_102354 [Actinopolymorpha cephalotaxi]